MKLCVYQMTMEEVYRHCMSGLSDAGYQVEMVDKGKGSISAVKQDDFPLHFSLIDLKIFRSKYAVTVSIISSNLSKLFGSFYHNRIDEEVFIDHFLGRLRTEARKSFDAALRPVEVEHAGQF